MIRNFDTAHGPKGSPVFLRFSLRPTLSLGLALMILTVALPDQSQGQVVPATPKNFRTRGVGDATGTANVNVTPPPVPPTIIRTVTYYSLSEPRQWTSTDGKAVVAKLIAFEEHVAESVKGAPTPTAAPAPSALTTPPTIVREGKIRLLLNSKPYELALDRLSAPDKEFVEGVKAAVAKPK